MTFLDQFARRRPMNVDPFPKLRAVECAARDITTLENYSPLFLRPELTSLTIYLQIFRSVSSKEEPSLHILADLITQATMLDSLRILLAPPANASTVLAQDPQGLDVLLRQCDRLSSIDIPDNLWTAAALQEVARKQDLRVLKIPPRNPNRPSPNFNGNLITTFATSSSKKSAPSTFFPSLRELQMTFAGFSSVASMYPLQQLQSLSIADFGGLGFDFTELSNVCTSLVALHVTIRGNKDMSFGESVDLSVYKPLLRSSLAARLKEFSLNFDGVLTFDYDDLVYIAGKLPSIERLSLNPSPRNPCSPTETFYDLDDRPTQPFDPARYPGFHGMLPFVSLCPNIRSLEYWIPPTSKTTYAIPEFTHRNAFPKLERLFTGKRSIRSKDAVPMAKFLVAVLPADCVVPSEVCEILGSTVGFKDLLSAMMDVKEQERIKAQDTQRALELEILRLKEEVAVLASSESSSSKVGGRRKKGAQ